MHPDFDGAAVELFEHDLLLVGLGLGGFRGFIGTLVPDDDGATAILALGNDAFEVFVVVGMVFDKHGQVLDGGVHGRAFGDGPAFQDAFYFQTEIIM